MKVIIIGLLLIVVSQACQISNKEIRVLSDKELREVQGLSTINLQRSYLMNIFNSDQDIRNKYEFVLIENGYGTTEFKEHLKEMKSVDELNLMKIDMYLNLYGYPVNKKHGNEVVDVPCLVVHHFADEKVSEKYFEIFKKAYFSEDLSESIFLFYLRSFYELKYNKKFQATNFENEIDQIILELSVN